MYFILPEICISGSFLENFFIAIPNIIPAVAVTMNATPNKIKKNVNYASVFRTKDFATYKYKY